MVNIALVVLAIWLGFNAVLILFLAFLYFDNRHGEDLPPKFDDFRPRLDDTKPKEKLTPTDLSGLRRTDEKLPWWHD
jgi:hypothetical protein